MSLVLTWGAKVPVIRIARMGGQVAFIFFIYSMQNQDQAPLKSLMVLNTVVLGFYLIYI